uniref:Capsid protein n=1 Tax=Turdus hortulorum Genomoviridae sp. TaxID=2814995 RepID=A0A8A4XD18_9VIRU|nr:MAG: capsid protein [Gemycircularvirus]
MPPRYLNRRRTIGVSRRRKFTSSRYRRSSRAPRRTYRKPIRRMSRRGMINTLSKKKRDTSMSAAASDETNPGPEAPFTGLNVRVSAATGTNTLLPGVHSFLYVPTERFLAPNNAYYVAQRTASNPFYKGISETYTFLPNDSSVWWHRRIVFATKRRYEQEIEQLANGGYFAPGTSSTQNTRRKLRDMSMSDGLDGFEAIQANLIADVFRGVFNVDWFDSMRAALDKTRITVLSDRLTTIKSQNDSPAPRIVKHYTPINKTVVYADEESGQTMQPSQFSVESKTGLGNIYILDLVECPVPTDTTTTTVSFGSTQTVYWHEK